MGNGLPLPIIMPSSRRSLEGPSNGQSYVVLSIRGIQGSDFCVISMNDYLRDVQMKTRRGHSGRPKWGAFQIRQLPVRPEEGPFDAVELG